MKNQVYEDVCLAAAQCNSEYLTHLVDTEDHPLVEGVQGQYKWGSGLNQHATSCTRFDKLSGENQICKVHMTIRQS